MSESTPISSGPRRLLMVMQLPPPFHGHSFMSLQAQQALQGEAGIEVRTIPLHFNADMTRIGRFASRKILILLRTAWRLAGELAIRRPDRVYFTPCASGTWALLRDMALIALMRAFRVPILHHLHGLGIQEGIRRRPWMRRWFRFMFARSDVICLGRIQSADVAGVFDGVPFILPNGIPAGGAVAAVSRPESGAIPRLLYISHLMTAKGVLDFMELLERLSKAGVPFDADIAGGDGDVTRSGLEERVKAMGLDGRVRVLGAVHGAAKDALFEASDIMVFPSRFQESFGLVLVEAMRAGLPVVASTVGGVPEIVRDGETGWLYPSGDIGRLLDRVLALMRDPGLRRRMGAAGRQRFLDCYTSDLFQSGFRSIVRTVTGMAAARRGHEAADLDRAGSGPGGRNAT